MISRSFHSAWNSCKSLLLLLSLSLITLLLVAVALYSTTITGLKLYENRLYIRVQILVLPLVQLMWRAATATCAKLTRDAIKISTYKLIQLINYSKILRMFETSRMNEQALKANNNISSRIDETGYKNVNASNMCFIICVETCVRVFICAQTPSTAIIDALK